MFYNYCLKFHFLLKKKIFKIDQILILIFDIRTLLEILVDFKNINGHTHIAGNLRWLQFDLKERKAEIDSYLIKSAHTDEDSHSSYYLKNWKLETSLYNVRCLFY